MSTEQIDTPGTDGAKHTPTPWAVNPTGDMWDGLVGTLEEPVAVCEGDTRAAISLAERKQP